MIFLNTKIESLKHINSNYILQLFSKSSINDMTSFRENSGKPPQQSIHLGNL